ncbi:MAG: CinA family nicotinamide mononucleotide deamidase-related protein [Chloroflexi bacterium]|nr:CinA family nicotinamide mononucleotide deamidase-related protein [Chloroflexota bacterium]
MPNAEIVSIGSELLLGQIVDTNAAWMAQRLTDLGVNLFYKTVVGDNPGRMKEVISHALDRSDIVITGGGLGPTQDDLTREIIADATGRRLVLDPGLVEQLERRFQRRGLIMTPNNERQAYIPEGAIIVDNPNGTAPSFIVEDPRGIVFALPGVPFELKWLFDNEVAPYLRRKFDLSETIAYRVLKVADMGESSVDDLIGHLIANSTNPTVGVLAHPGQVDVRIAAKASSVEAAMNLIGPTEDEVRTLLGRHIFATDAETMEGTVGKLLDDHDVSVSVYEDLTGGLVADRLTQANAGRFVEGIVANGLSSIRRLLESSRDTESADMLLGDPASLTQELAWCVREKTESDLGLAVHTIPDPDERVENLAAGQTYISVTDGKDFRSRTYPYGGRGRPDRTRMSLNAIEQVRVALLEGFQ